MRSVRKLNKSRKHRVRKHHTRKNQTRKHHTRKHRSRKHRTRKHRTRKHRSRKHHKGGLFGFGGLSEQEKLQKLRNSGLLMPSRSNPGLVTVVRLQPNEVAPFDPQSFLTWLENQNNIKVQWNNIQKNNNLYKALRAYSRMQANNSNIARDRQITDARYNVNQQQVFGNPQGMSTEAYGQMMYERS